MSNGNAPDRGVGGNKKNKNKIVINIKEVIYLNMENMGTTEKAQSVETVEVKKTKISKTYTLTQLGEMIKKLRELKWITDEEEKYLLKIREKAKAEFIKGL